MLGLAFEKHTLLSYGPQLLNELETIDSDFSGKYPGKFL